MPGVSHLEIPWKNRCPGRYARHALSVCFFIAAFYAGIDVAGAGAVPAVSFSPNSITFAGQAVSTMSAAQSVTLINTDDAALSISSLALTGANASDFAVSNDCGSSVAAAAQCTVSVTFKPSASGTRTAAITFTDNASGSPQTVTLSGTGTAPAVSLSPNSITFASPAVSTTDASQTVTLNNTGNAALSISSHALTSTNPGDFAQTNICESSVGATANCTVGVTFRPTPIGSRTPAVSLSPSTITFASQAVSTTSAAQTITLKNTGKAALSIASLALTGTNPGDFAQTNTCGSSAAAGARCTISVTFTPTASGTRTAAVTFTDNAGGSPQSVSLTGTGAGAVASLSPTGLTFASQAVGTTSTAQTITLNNTGNAALSISSLTLTGTNPSDFAQTNTCGSSVAAGANCTVSVTFTPAATGTRTATVTFTDNATGSPQTISLTGTGAGAVASLSPTSLTFASQAVGTTSAAQTVTLNNTGNAAFSISSLTLTGTNPGDFAQTNTCGSSVAAGGNCTISVTFTPAASGIRTAAVTFTDNATGSPQSVSLSGTGTSSSNQVSISPSSLTFGNEPVDTTSSSQSVTLNNTGGAALSITSIAFTGADAADFTEANTCSTSVAAGGNCTIVIMFTPSASGVRSASLTIADNASGSPQSVSLSGAGTHDVILTWTASPSPGVGGYNVYRGTSSGGESSTPLNSSPVPGTTFDDVDVAAGQTYYYVVIALTSNGITLSGDSNEASATVPSP